MTTTGKIKWTMFLFVVVLLVIVAFQNLEVIEVRVLFWDQKLTKAVVLTITVLIGFLLGFFARTFWQFQVWRKRGKANRPTGQNEITQD